MTVEATSRKAGPFSGNGVTTAFPFTFKVFTTSDIEITQTDAAGVETVLTLDAHYTVSLNADQDNDPGGTITYPASGTGYLATGETLTGLDVTPASQGADITNAGRFLPQVFEDALDRLTIGWQQLLEKVGRALLVPVSESGPEALPSIEDRAGYFLAFDADGNPVAASGTGNDAALRADLAASGGSALVGFLQQGTGAVSRSLQTRMRDVIYATDFMSAAQVTDVRIFGYAQDVTAEVQLAINAALVYGKTLVFPPGGYKITCGSTVIFTYGNSAANGVTANVYRALNINSSNLNIVGMAGATLYVKPYAGDLSGVHYAFATAKNMTVGDLTNISLRGLSFEFNPDNDGGAYTKRAAYFGGVQGVTYDDIYVYSTGVGIGPGYPGRQGRSGATMTCQQCKTVRVTRYRLKHCTQGFNFSYVDDVMFNDLQFDDFSEAIDFDRKVTNFSIHNTSFRNGLTASGVKTGQCIDLNSCVDGEVIGVNVLDVGNIVTINYKQTTPPTYAQYVALADADVIAYNQANLSFSPSKRVSVSGVRGTGVGEAAGSGACIYLGIDRSADFVGGGPCEDITVKDVKLKDIGYTFRVEDVKNFLIQDIRLDTLTLTNDPAVGAFIMSADGAYADAELSGKLQDIEVKDVSCKGFRISAPTKLIIDNVRVDGFNTANTAGNGRAFHISALNDRAGRVYIDRTLARNGLSTPVAWTFSEDGAGVFVSQIHWGEGNRIEIATVPTAISFGAAGMQTRIKKRMHIPIGTFSIAAGSTKDFPLLMPQVGKGMVLCYHTAYLSQTFAASGNNITTDTRSLVGGVDASIITANYAAGQAAGVEKNLGITFNAAGRQLASGDIAYCRLGAAAGTPVVEGLALQAHYIDYATS